MMKFLSEKSLTNKQLRWFILLEILVNAIGLLSPVLASNDANFYAVIAKHIALSNDFINLTFNQHSWLDKPHFPFWITAISYKIFGISVFAYMLPGFLFYLLGGLYLYLLAKHMFASKEVGLLSVLIYFTSLHLMLSSIDVRQEAYLLGEIIPACYYWILYDEQSSIRLKNLILGAVFTGLAVMTKGVFVLLTIFSGLFAVWIFTTRSRKLFISKKWLLALLLSFICIIPELVVLYLQFDLHSEREVFGHNHISGIKWFFWDSQFGRFFNTGPIVSGKSNSISNYFYYFHTLLWAFLPWSLVTIFAGYNIIKSIRVSKLVPENLMKKKERQNYIYLLSTIIPTFILFSLTSFQLDHYTNILIPFMAILCAEFLFNTTTKLSKHPIFTLQIGVSYLLCGIVIILAVLILNINGQLFSGFIVASIITIILFVLLAKNYPLTKAIVYPVMAVSLVFVFVEAVNAKLYSKYDLGYLVNKSLAYQHDSYKIIDYNVSSLSLEFLSKHDYQRIDNLNALNLEPKPYYLVINQVNWKAIHTNPIFRHGLMLNTFKVIRQDKFIKTLFNYKEKQQYTDNVLLIQVK